MSALVCFPGLVALSVASPLLDGWNVQRPGVMIGAASVMTDDQRKFGVVANFARLQIPGVVGDIRFHRIWCSLWKSSWLD